MNTHILEKGGKREREESWVKHMGLLEQVFKRMYSNNESHTLQFTTTGFFFFFIPILCLSYTDEPVSFTLFDPGLPYIDAAP